MRYDPDVYKAVRADMMAELSDCFWSVFFDRGQTDADVELYGAHLRRTDDAAWKGFASVFREDSDMKEYDRCHEAAHSGFLSVFDDGRWDTPSAFWNNCLATERANDTGFRAVFAEGRA